jgi:outer membrane protein insertion porin family
MRNTCLCTTVATALLVTFCASARPLLAQAAQPVVAKITLRNNYLLPPQQVLSGIGVSEGMPLDAGNLEAAIARWNQDGTLGTISYRIEPAGEGKVELVLSLSERVQLTAVRFRGNRHFTDERLSSIAGMAAGGTATRIQAQASERDIAAAYLEEGFPLVQVRGQLGPVGPSTRDLTFYVSEGPRVWVEAIVFEGNKQVPAGSLRPVMDSRTRWWIAFLRPGWLKEETFQDDVRRVETAYHDMGYLDAQAGGYATYSDDMRRATLHVAVYEGPLYHVKDVLFDGNTVYRSDELLEAIPLAAGRPYRPAELEGAVRRISELYANQGYMDVTSQKGNLTAQPAFEPAGAQVTVRFTVHEGEPIFIRRIQIRGLTKTRESVVRRDLTFYPGERASMEKIRESERRLLNTGYFDMQSERPVEITLEPDEGALRDAIVQVTEGATGGLRVGAGVGSESGLMGEVSLTEEDFDISNWPRSWDDLIRGNALRGGGQKLSLLLRPGTRRSYYSLSFLEPSVQDSDYSLGTSLYSAGLIRREFDETRTGLNVTGGQRVSDFLTHRLTVGYEQVGVGQVSSTAAEEIRRDKGSHSKPYVRLGTALDRVDSRFVPTEGYAAGAELELAAGDVEAAKLLLDGRSYWPVGETASGGKKVVGLRGRIGMVDSYGHRVPVYERFYAGGFSTLRGFKFEGVSPVDRATGDAVGGDAMLLGSAEYSVPVALEDRLRLVVFTDFGYVTRDVQDVLTGWDELRLSLGTGLRWLVPSLGPAAIEVDLALPMVKQHGDETQYISFSVGAGVRF